MKQIAFRIDYRSMSEVTIGNFLLIMFLVLLNGFFVASEFAFVKLRITRLNALLAQGSRRAKRAKYIVDDLDRSMSSTQLGITIASVALGFVGEEFFEELVEPGLEAIAHWTNISFLQTQTLLTTISFFLALIAITFLHVVMGELAPKSLSIQFTEKVALACAEPLYWFMRITDPLLSFFVWSSNSLLRTFNVTPAKETHHQVYSEDELKVIIEDSIAEGEIEPYESRLIFNILDFTDSNVKSILTPRIDIKAVEIDATPDSILKLSQETGYSRIPVYENTLDGIKGFVHIKDIIVFANGKPEIEFDIRAVLRPVIVTPEGKPLDDLLKEMQKLKTQVAVIVDEYGVTEGLVTIEDILEYIVGPIEDEFDLESSTSIKVEDNFILAGGLIAIETFNSTIEEVYDMKITSQEAATLAGYVLELFESEIPQEGMKVSDDQFVYEVAKATGQRLEEIKVSPKKEL